MKKQLTSLLFSALTLTAAAERPSLDETAVRLGVRDWFLVRTAGSESLDNARLRSIYRTDVEFTDPTAHQQTATAHGLKAYTALWQPLVAAVKDLNLQYDGNVAVSVKGPQVLTTFVFRPTGIDKNGQPLNCVSRVNLTWERHDGQWQIVREELSPEKTAAPIATVADAK